MRDATNILPNLWPDQQVRVAACRLLAASIVHAHTEGPGAWVVTLLPDAVRLNVGQVAMVTIRHNAAILYFRKPTRFALPPGAKRLYENRRSVYSERAVPLAIGMIRLPLASLGNLSAGLIKAHLAAISSAAEAKQGSPWKGHLSESALRYIEDSIGQQLPRPEYGTLADADLGEEVIEVGTFPEGSVRRIVVNAYERNHEVRRVCLAHYGRQCAACRMTFAEKYGPAADGFIHVHHLRQLSSVGADHQVDPRIDLRPVCPNCHAVIHLRTPPYSIEEVREMMSRQVTDTGGGPNQALHATRGKDARA